MTDNVVVRPIANPIDLVITDNDTLVLAALAAAELAGLARPDSDPYRKIGDTVLVIGGEDAVRIGGMAESMDAYKRKKLLDKLNEMGIFGDARTELLGAIDAGWRNTEHKLERPSDLLSHLYVAQLTITNLRVVKGDYTPKTYWGYLARSTDGKMYGQNWDHMDEASMSPGMTWTIQVKEGVDYIKVKNPDYDPKDSWTNPEELSVWFHNLDVAIVRDIAQMSNGWSPATNAKVAKWLKPFWPTDELFICEATHIQEGAGGRMVREGHEKYGLQYKKEGCFMCKHGERPAWKTRQAERLKVMEQQEADDAALIAGKPPSTDLSKVLQEPADPSSIGDDHPDKK